MFGYFWHRIPFFRFLIPLLLGILLGFSIPVYTWFFILLSGLFFLFFLIQVFLKSLRWKSILQGLCVVVLFFSLGLIRSNTFLRQNLEQQNALKSDQIILRIIDLPSLQAKRIKCVAEIFNLQEFQKGSFSFSKCLVYFDSSLYFSIQPGFCYAISASQLQLIPSALNPNEFNYRKYLSLKGIFYQVDFTKSNPNSFYQLNDNFPFLLAFQSQNYIRKTLYNCIAENEIRAVAMALLYGYDDEIGKELSQQYAITGTLHVLAVSGMHVGLVFLFLDFVLVFLEKNQTLKILKALIILSSVWFYSLLCGMSPSILRAAVMISFFVLSKLFQRVYNPVNTLSASAFLMLLVQPEMVYDAGFQLSYFAVLGLSLFYQPIYFWYEPKSWLSDQIWKLMAASVAAQITTFPLSLLYFHQFPILFLLSNLLIIPLSTFAIYLGIALLVFSKFTWLAQFLITGLKFIIGLSNSIAAAIASIPFCSVNGIFISNKICCLLFVLIFFIMAFLYQRQFWQIKSSLLLILVLLVTGVFSYFHMRSRSFLRIYAYPNQTCFVVVNQGYASLFADSSFVENRHILEFINQEFNNTQLVILPAKKHWLIQLNQILLSNHVQLLKHQAVASKGKYYFQTRKWQPIPNDTTITVLNLWQKSNFDEFQRKRLEVQLLKSGAFEVSL